MILTPSKEEVQNSGLWLVPELEDTEIGNLLRNNPQVRLKFIEECAKGEIDWNDFSAAERGILLNGILEAKLSDKESSVRKALWEADWIRQPPSVEEFLDNPLYLGDFSKEIYKPWREDLKYVLDPKNEIYCHILSGGIGVGKSKIAVVSQLYKLCVLTCLKNIPSYFKLAGNTRISFGMFSLSLDKAGDVLADDFKSLISGSPYFKNVFPLKKSRKMKTVLNNMGDGTNRMSEDYEVVLPQGLRVLMGSKVSHALSYAVVSAILDEMNFRGKSSVKDEDDEDSAEKLFDEIRTRIQSRFSKLGHSPGILSVISSKKTTSDFLDQLIVKLDGSLTNKTGSWVCNIDKHAFISSYSQWDVKPDDYSKKKFWVFIGSSKTSSKIIPDNELALYPPDSPNLIAIPENVRFDFEMNINTALRQYAGISTSPQHLLFEDPTYIPKAFCKDRRSPFGKDEIFVGLNTTYPISYYLNTDDFFYDAAFAMIPKHHPSMLRTIHIDLSTSGDATGITMGGVSKIKQMTGKNAFGEEIIKAMSPEIFIDFSIALKAPHGDQIDFEKIQQFITFLRSMKFNIHLITFDQFQSTGTMQMLKKDNFTVDHTSVDRTDLPYQTLKNVIQMGNLNCPYNKKLATELSNLIISYTAAKAKVDHPRMFPDGSKGSKDISDSLSGCVWNCYQMLTDQKKHPMTYNANFAGTVFKNMVENQKNKTDEFNTISGNEEIELNKFIESKNPFNFKITP